MSFFRAPRRFDIPHIETIPQIGVKVKTYFTRSRNRTRLAYPKTVLDSVAELKYNGLTRTENTLNSFDFRQRMIQDIRAFEKDAHSADMEFGQVDWPFEEWFDHFISFVTGVENEVE